jgi:hypothetical protein
VRIETANKTEEKACRIYIDPDRLLTYNYTGWQLTEITTPPDNGAALFG